MAIQVRSADKTRKTLNLKSDYDRLLREYDAKAGGYNVTTGTASNRAQQFIKSKFTPGQGGYYADTNLADFVDATRAANISGYYNKLKKPKTTVGGGKPGTDFKDLPFETFDQQQRKSALRPYQRVNPSVKRSRQTNKKQRTLANGRSGTILTSTLGGGSNDKKRKTLLG